MVFNFVFFAYNENMRFELTEELIDEILFFMEDQGDEFYVDAEEGEIVPSIEIHSDDDDVDGDDDIDDRYFLVPEWSPSDGFRLMESFTASLRNSVVRKKLSAALDRGKGVFRAFKDTLSEFPEVEKLWFAHKDREMKREVIHWYNALRESWGMELIGEEPEDTEDIAGEDFRFRDGSTADSDAAEKLHLLCIQGDKNVAQLGPWIFPGDMCIVAESSGGEFAAYISVSAVNAVAADSSGLHVNALEVQPEYRGLGLAKTLLSKLLARLPELAKFSEQAADGKTRCISIDLPAEFENFSRVLNRESFRPAVTRYYREI